MRQGEVMNGTVLIAGLGLMGGSLALALRKASPVKIVGLDNDPDTVMQALKRHAIDEVCTSESVAQADMLV
ncbi:MAG: prephenate dehydrogenase, partial [Clostridia bacterium]|nr:prephenate dehydrogenase [Clostridia bacterium]